MTDYFSLFQVSGFVYVTSVLVSLEGKLKSDELMDRDMLQLIHIVFYTISTAMRFEPANAKFFHHEVSTTKFQIQLTYLVASHVFNTTNLSYFLQICMTTLYETIRLLGCFTEDVELQNDTEPGDPELYEVFHELFTGNILEMT